MFRMTLFLLSRQYFVFQMNFMLSVEQLCDQLDIKWQIFHIAVAVEMLFHSKWSNTQFLTMESFSGMNGFKFMFLETQ